jgi:hypothetical protein
MFALVIGVVFNYAKSKYTHIYRESLVKYVVSVIDYNISLFRTASRSNYAKIDYTKNNVQLIRNDADEKLQKVNGRCLNLCIDHYVFSLRTSKKVRHT